MHHKLLGNEDNGIKVWQIHPGGDNLPGLALSASSSARPSPGEFSLQNKDKYSTDGLNRGSIDTKPKGFAP